MTLKRSPMPPRKTGLKSGGPLPRRTGLKSGGSLQRGKGLVRKAALGRLTPLLSGGKPAAKKTPAKPKRRPDGYVSEGDGKDIVDERSEGWCEVQLLGICLGRGESWHHRIDRSIGGTWDPANGLKTCGDGTRGCHGWITDNPKQAREDGGWALGSQAKPELERVLIASPKWPGERRWVLLNSQGGTALVDSIGEAS